MKTNDTNGKQPEAHNISPSNRPADHQGSAPLSDADLDQVAGGAKKLDEHDPEQGGEIFRSK